VEVSSGFLPCRIPPTGFLPHGISPTGFLTHAIPPKTEFLPLNTV